MGFGTSSLGVSTPYGYGTPITISAPPTGASGVRFINSGSRDYEQDPDTLQLKQMPFLRQRVLIKLLTLKGSSTVQPNFGVNLPDKMGTGFERLVALSVRNAFRQETEVEKIMRIDAVEVRKLFSGRAEVILSYTDLSTGEELKDSTILNGR